MLPASLLVPCTWPSLHAQLRARRARPLPTRNFARHTLSWSEGPCGPQTRWASESQPWPAADRNRDCQGLDCKWPHHARQLSSSRTEMPMPMVTLSVRCATVGNGICTTRRPIALSVTSTMPRVAVFKAHRQCRNCEKRGETAHCPMLQCLRRWEFPLESVTASATATTESRDCLVGSWQNHTIAPFTR